MKNKFITLLVLVTMLVSVLPNLAFGQTANYTELTFEKQGPVASVATATPTDVGYEFGLMVYRVGTETDFTLYPYYTTDCVTMFTSEDGENYSTNTNFNFGDAKCKYVYGKFVSTLPVSVNCGLSLASYTDLYALLNSKTQYEDMIEAPFYCATNKHEYTKRSVYEGCFHLEFRESDVKTIEIKRIESDNTKYANGISSYTIKAQILGASGYGISGKEVKFTALGGNASFTKSVATSKTGGWVETEVYTSTPGEVKIYAECDSTKSPEIVCTFKSTGVTTIKAQSESSMKLAKSSSNVVDFKYSFYDNSGNFIKVSSPVVSGNKIKFSDTEITLDLPSGLKMSDFSVSADDNGYLNLKFTANIKVGDYSFKAYLINGSCVNYSFTIKEQCTVTAMTLKLDAAAFAKNSTTKSTPFKVEYVDAEGYALVASLSDITFTSSDASKLVITNTNNIKTYDQLGEVTITAISSSKSLAATAVVSIVKPASAIKITPVACATNSKTTFAIQLVDGDGNAVVDSNYSGEAKAFFTTKAANQLVSTIECDDNDLAKTGKGTISFTAYTEGTYTITALFGTYAGSTTFTVSKNTENVTSVVFMIGASSYMSNGKAVEALTTPFVIDGRTYLGIRDMGNAIGASVVYNNETGMVTLVKGKAVVELVADTDFITVNGVTVANDAPAINKDGRIYLPFRIVFEAFGYGVNYEKGIIVCK